MFDRFKQKQKTVVQVVKEEPKFIATQEQYDTWVKMGYDAKEEITEFLKPLTRVELMQFQDLGQFDGTKCEEAAWEAANDIEWLRDYPMGKHEYTERIPDIVRNSLPIKYHMERDKKGKDIPLDLNELVIQVQGMQKKLDKIEKLIANAEFKLCGEAALKL